MKTQISSEARALLDSSWLLTPARMAERLTRGRFQRYRHVQFLERKLAQAIVRGGARLVISMPPRHGKSWLASLFTPAWFLTLWPERRVILSAHDSTVAMLWGRSVRDFLKHNRSELAIRLAGGSASSSWNTVQGGGMVTTGIGGSICGSGGDLLIVDDPLKSWTEAASENVRQKQIDWFNSTLQTHAEPGASIIVIMTRSHEHDLAGYLEAEQKGWEVLRIPAIAEENDPLGRQPGVALCEERYSVEVLSQIRTRVGSRLWTALYQQSPAAEQGAILKREWWRYYQQSPERFDEVLMSWDLAFKDTRTSDYVVGQVWGRLGESKFLIDQVRGRMDFPATVQAVRGLAARYPQAARKLIEAKANGSAVLSSLKGSIPGLIPVEPRGGKRERVTAISGDIEAGRVHLPAPLLAPWVEDFVAECTSFPGGQHDDQVDAMAYALTNLNAGGF